ncbi:hypothetical protein BP5796_10634 [Coleophoma crateriformis]|uniref:SGNH hydrolase-type esterase domain-containing protein n=1 Tax=Coleophoma crateriformis TaxID=565419 RepID=A0A3D8QQP8_9HELO|nr:hypothetical protein BP5796_10634 [Coleophoma crateriformis]
MIWQRSLAALSLLVRLSHCQNTTLVILPLGDSITYGTDSTDGNGYRQNLETLVEATTPVNYIGSVQAGSMSDNDNEGHPGFTITQIGAQAVQDFTATPDVVLLMAGTNDVLQGLNLSTAPDRLSTLIDQLITGMPKAAILVATLTPLTTPSYEALRETYNAALPAIVAAKVSAGSLVQLVDMSNVTDAQIASADGIHPNDAGYVTMAYAWYAGLMEAAAKGWIATSANSSSSSSSNGTMNGTAINTFAATSTISLSSATASSKTSSATSATKTSAAISVVASLSLAKALLATSLLSVILSGCSMTWF